MKILLHGLNYAPEEIGIGKYSGEMIDALAAAGHECVVVTTPPYYPQWEIQPPYSGLAYRSERLVASGEGLGKGSEFRGQSLGVARGPSPGPESPTSPASGRGDSVSTSHSPLATSNSLPSNSPLATSNSPSHSPLATSSSLVIRCPLWVPGNVTGLKRVLHLASFGISSVPVVLWKAITFRPDVILTVEPAAMCMPTTWIASRISGAKCWLHVQDFEVDAAFDLGILKQPLLRRIVLAAEAFLMRRFDRVSSISPNMLLKLVQKGVDERRVVAFPNWVDCRVIRPLAGGAGSVQGEGEESVQSSEFSVQEDGACEPSPSSHSPLATSNSLPSHSPLATSNSLPSHSPLATSNLLPSNSLPSHSPLATSHFPSLREQFGIPGDKFVALYAGNIGKKQGLEIIAHAAEMMLPLPVSCEGEAGGHADIHFVICGHGAAVERLREQVKDLPNVQLLPPQPFEVFNELMNCADVHLLPQLGGAADLVMPSKLTGMLATGRPVVTCADPGTQIADVVQGHGLVVPPGAVADFAAAIERLARDPELCAELGTAARKYAVDHLSGEAILRRFMKDLQALLG